jgi:hypothetical protein
MLMSKMYIDEKYNSSDFLSIYSYIKQEYTTPSNIKIFFRFIYEII